MARPSPVDYAVAAATTILYGILGFYIERYDTIWLLTSYFVAFGLYLVVIARTDPAQLNFWLTAAIVFRLLLTFSLPRLSDDFYRFIWDGHLMAGGYHPFAEVPSYYINHQTAIPGISRDLYEHLNSPDYFTVYPPFAQFIFWLSVTIFPASVYGSVVAMKLVVVASEIGSLYLMRSLLRRYHLPEQRLLLYALNPLVIVELVGNIHLEAVMIFFLLLTIHFAAGSRYIQSGVALGFGVCAKLLPLIFLPAIVLKVNWRKSLILIIAMATCCLILFLPLWDPSIVLGFRDSLGYYFRKFEFNASIFYLVRSFGFWFYGYDIIQTAGWKLALISTALIMWISAAGTIKKQSTDQGALDPAILSRFLAILMTYYLFATTIHPWYVTTLIAVSVFTPFRFPVVWTGTIFLTYIGYTEFDFQEPFTAVAVEYIVVVGYLAYEILWKRSHYSLRYS